MAEKKAVIRRRFDNNEKIYQRTRDIVPDT